MSEPARNRNSRRATPRRPRRSEPGMGERRMDRPLREAPPAAAPAAHPPAPAAHAAVPPAHPAASAPHPAERDLPPRPSHRSPSDRICRTCGRICRISGRAATHSVPVTCLVIQLDSFANAMKRNHRPGRTPKNLRDASPRHRWRAAPLSISPGRRSPGRFLPAEAGWRPPEPAGRRRRCPSRRCGAPGRRASRTALRRCGRRFRLRSPS